MKAILKSTYIFKKIYDFYTFLCNLVINFYMYFVKLHGLGNDFVLTEDPSVSDKISLITDRKRGIGCDQVILVGELVRFWNQDGSEAQFCGNGSRAVFRYLGTGGSIMTQAGSVQGRLIGDLVEITYPYGKILETHETSYLVDVGNRHLVSFGDTELICEMDPTINYMSLNYSDRWYMRIHEAGVGETEACGSGAMAASLAIWNRFMHKDPIRIHMKGGFLDMEYPLIQLGPATIVFDGTIKY